MNKLIKRIFDILVSLFGLIFASPVVLIFALAVFIQDGGNPFYIPNRVGKKGNLFKMYKLRSMVVNADSNLVDSTSANDSRITSVGRLIRKFKLDEIIQLFNVLKGEMSLVGPRPNVQREVDLYTDLEKKLLDVKPGITDISSIIFSDESEILKDSKDPDIDYNQLIRPWKGYFGLLYINNSNIKLDIYLIYLTVIAIINRQKALKRISQLTKKLNASEEACEIAKRLKPLKPMPPFGSNDIVYKR